MDEETKRFVRERADNRCEYCRVQQQFYPDFTFHIEHIVARQHRGPHPVPHLCRDGAEVMRRRPSSALRPQGPNAPR